MRPGRWPVAAIAAGCAGCASAPRTAPTLDEGAPSHGLSIEWIGSTRIPSDVAFDDRPLGGLSGLAYREGRWFAVSDDAKQPRVYELEIGVEAGTVRARAVAVHDLPEGPRDAEAVQTTPDGGLYVGYEAPAAIARIDADYKRIEPAPMPAHFVSGARANRGVEALALIGAGEGSGAALWVGMETALVDDGPEATAKAGACCRVLLIDLGGAGPAREHVYVTEPAPGALLGASFNSLVEFQGLADGRVLALERSLDPLGGYSVAIRVVTPGRGEDDLSGTEAVRASDASPLDVRTIWRRGSLQSLGPGNVEGMALGPTLDDGRAGRLLVLISDDNFGRDEPFTNRDHRGALVIALRLIEPQ